MMSIKCVLLSKKSKKFNLHPFPYATPCKSKAILTKWLKGAVHLHQCPLTLILLKWNYEVTAHLRNFTQSNEAGLINRQGIVYPSLLLALWGPPPQLLGHRGTSIIFSHKNEKSLHGSEVNEISATNMKQFFPLPKALRWKERTKSQSFQRAVSSLTQDSLSSWFALRGACHLASVYPSCSVP